MKREPVCVQVSEARVPTFLRWQEFVCMVFAGKVFRPVVHELAQTATKLGKIFTLTALLLQVVNQYIEHANRFLSAEDRL